MNDLYKTHLMVEKMLINFPETRNSDALLYAKICEAINPIACNLGFTKVLLNRKEYGLPNFESVGRCRRKIQENNPLLRADVMVSQGRFESEAEYYEYVNSQI